MPEINYHHGDNNIEERNDDIEYIVVHYTGSGSSAEGCAEANCKYFSSDYRGASAHYFIDDSGIFEYADPEDTVTWHCGDGHGAYGITNQNSVGIEVCSSGEDFTETEIEFLHGLVVYLQARFGVDNDHVVRHYDASRKLCPAPYIDEDKWRTLHDYITSDTYDYKNEVDIKMDWSIVSVGGTGCLLTGGVLHPLASAEEQKFVEWIGAQMIEQIQRGEMPHIPLPNDPNNNGMYQNGDWGSVLVTILNRRMGA